MRRMATLVAAAALAGVLVVPAPAVAADSPLPELTQLTEQACTAKDAELPPKASVLVGPFVPEAPAVPQHAQAPQVPQVCSQT